MLFTKISSKGNHTVLLLEYNQDKDFFLDPKDALSGLLETEKGQKRKVISINICNCCIKNWIQRPKNYFRQNIKPKKRILENHLIQ